MQRPHLLQFLYSILGSIFVLIGIYAYQRKSPMYFYAESKIYTSEITDVKAYNRANGIMWITYGALYFIPILVHILVPDKNDTVLSVSVVICFLGLLAVLWIYQKNRRQIPHRIKSRYFKIRKEGS